MNVNPSVLDRESSTSPSLTLSPTEERRFNEFKSFREWMLEKFDSEYQDGRCFAVNLNFVSGISRESAKTQFRHFVSYLNRKVYGNAHNRYPKDKNIKLVAVIEGGGNTGKEVHYHSIIVNPYDRSYTDDEFTTLITGCWLKQPKAMKIPDVAVSIQNSYDLIGWINYLGKGYSKDKSNDISYLDFLDIQSSYF